MIALAVTAVSIGFLHTLLGPDHYLPFVMMGRAGGWSRARMLWITVACGVGHVIGSVALGALGIALGAAVAGLEAVEAARGDFAAWSLVAFGMVYAAWGLRRAWRRRPHSHIHVHADGTVHAHPHTHEGDHLHVHEPAASGASVARVTPWVLFAVFVLGPCEPLIPLMMYPAAAFGWSAVVAVAALYGIATIAAMAIGVAALDAGLARLSAEPLERYAHAVAGVMVSGCGLAILFLGL